MIPVNQDNINTEVRRELRQLGIDSASTQAANRRVLTGLFDSSADPQAKAAAVTGRRELFRLGGLTVAASAVFAACAYKGGEPGRVGVGQDGTPPPPVVVDDIVLLRTASSLEHSAINVYKAALDGSLLTGGAAELAKRFMDDHVGHAGTFEALTTAAGGTPFTCGNPKLDSALIAPVLARILTGVPAVGTALAIPPSDDVVRDLLNLAHGLESLAGATYQALVPLLRSQSLRHDAMNVGKVEARHAALLALTINPGGYLPITAEQAAEATTTVPATTVAQGATTTVAGGATAVAEPPPLPIAIPSMFGLLGAQPLIVGAGDENGVRLKVNLETPSLNSLVYTQITCE